MPSGSQARETTRAPRRAKSSGATREAAPFAQSSAMVRPERSAPARCTSASRYSARISGRVSILPSSAPVGEGTPAQPPRTSASISSSSASESL